MASREFIENRIAGKEQELTKLNKKMERILKAQAGNWETNNPYGYHERDIKYTQKDIEAAEKALNNYKAQLQAEIEKAASRNVPAILEFLENWKNLVTQLYEEGFDSYYADKAEVLRLNKVFSDAQYGTPEWTTSKEAFEQASKEFRCKRYGYYENHVVLNRWGKEVVEKVKIRDGEYEHLMPYTSSGEHKDASAKLNRVLTEEANRKYDFIIERTNAIVGEITDASSLKVGAKGDLNGFIKGTKGTAKVQTIGAGGHNIQIFHFRTLITPVKAKEEPKEDITKETNFASKSLEELEAIADMVGAECKHYDNAKIYRMHLVMAIKQAL